MRGVPSRTHHGAPRELLRGSLPYATAAVVSLLMMSGLSLYAWSWREETAFEQSCLSVTPGSPFTAMTSALDPKGQYVHVVGYDGPSGSRPRDISIFRRYRSYRFQNCEAFRDTAGRVRRVEHTRGTDFDDWTTAAHPRRAIVARLVVPLLP